MIFSGTRIVNNGLIFNYDAANARANRNLHSLLNWSTWDIGVGSVVGYTQNGDGNSRIIDVNPWGKNDVIWDVSNQDVASDADGGFVSDYIDIDNTKTYRYSCWIRRKVLGNGSLYFGTHGFNNVHTNIGVLSRSTGANNTNPYFLAGAWSPAVINDWYLMVGHIWPVYSGIGVNHKDSATYNVDGTKTPFWTGYTDFVWNPTITSTSLRSYLYYSTDITTNQQFYQPRIDLCDGSEPTIQELVSSTGSGFLTKDLCVRKNNLTSVGYPIFSEKNNGVMTFNGVNDYLVSEKTPDMYDEQTWEMWFKRSASMGTINMMCGSYLPYFSLDATSKVRFNIQIDLTMRSFFGSVLTNPDNVWYCFHFITKYDGVNTTLIIYKNAKLDTTSPPYAGKQSNSGFVSTRKFHIGTWNEALTFKFNGDIANVKIYNRRLSEDEMKINFNALRGRFGI